MVIISLSALRLSESRSARISIAGNKLAKIRNNTIAEKPLRLQEDVVLSNICVFVRRDCNVASSNARNSCRIWMQSCLNRWTSFFTGENLRHLHLSKTNRICLCLSSNRRSVGKGRHRRHLLLCPDSLLSGLSLSQRHILLDGCCLGADKVILSFLILSLESKSGILLLLLLYTLLLGTLGVHGTTDGLTCIGKERPIGAVSNGRSRGVLGRRGSESSQGVETSGLSVRDLPANTILSELLLMLIVELIEFCRISLRLARANETSNTANSSTNTTSD